MLTNYKVKEILKQWKQECGVTHTVLFRYHSHTGVLDIFTDKPGPMIGYQGEKVFKYENIFKLVDKDFCKVHFTETTGIA